jgi:tRNA(adenine34) deaminase
MDFLNVSEDDVKFMKMALDEARLSLESDDVPVGAVIVRDGEVISSSHNMREADGCATAHAEVKAIESACKKLGRWRLSDCIMYVTIEPCIMCAGAIINARIGKVIFGAKSPKAGACVSVIDVNAYSFGAKAEFISGVCEEECGELISEFFKKKRMVE